MKKIALLLLNKIVEATINTLFTWIGSLFIVLCTISLRWLKTIETFSHEHLLAVLILFVLGWSAAIIFGLKVYSSSSKKLTNRIMVDKKGECYCPECYKFATIIQHPKHPGHLVFSCKNCEDFYSPILDDGKSVTAHEFYAFQKANPQTTLTREAYQEWTNKLAATDPNSGRTAS